MFKNIFVFLLFISIAFAGMAGDRNLSQLKSILRKLIAAVDTFPSSKKPVDIVIKEMNDINACAIPKCQNCSYKNNTIEVTSGLIDFLGMNENYLCYILAHELVHILLHQSVHQDTNRQVAKYFSRKAEKEADLTGLKIYLIAGYSYREAVNAMKKIKLTMGDYSSFEALSSDHPSWTQRLEYLDSNQAELWRAMCTFENGVYFLESQNYEIAVILFRKVVKEFPQCFEAYANMGYARLMQYFDGFTEEDIKEYTIGQLALGGFYRRPASIQEKIRGMDKSKWWEAIGYLKQSLLIKEGQALVKANLGIAYYFDPRKLNTAESSRYLDEAAQSIEKDQLVDDLSKAVVYNNLAALGLFSRDQMNVRVTDLLSRAVRASKKAYATSFGPQSTQVSNTASVREIVEYNDNLYRYNQHDTTYLSSSAYEQYLEDFLLKNINNPHIWWNNVYARYEQVCRANKHTVRPVQYFRDQAKVPPTQPVTSVVCNDTVVVFLSQRLEDVNALLGKPDTIILSRERKLFEYLYPEKGIRIIGNEEVIMISMVENSSCMIAVNNDMNKKVHINEKLPEISGFLNMTPEKPYKLADNFKQYYIDQAGICLYIDKDQIIRKIQVTQYPYAN